MKLGDAGDVGYSETFVVQLHTDISQKMRIFFLTMCTFTLTKDRISGV